MRRIFIPAVACVFLAGCTQSTAPQVKVEVLEARVDELAARGGKLELRMDELAREIISLKERVEILEQSSIATNLKIERALSAPVVVTEPPVEAAPSPKVVEAAPVKAGEPKPPEASAPLRVEEVEKTLEVVKLKPPAPTADKPKVPVAEDGAAELYSRAYGAFKKGRLAKAILDFEDFIYSHPDHDYAGDARYWIGE